LVQVPQVAGAVRSASQPLLGFESQLAKPEAHWKPHVALPVQVARVCCPLPGQAFEHVPQVAAVLRSASQPLPAFESQLSKPVLH